MTKTLSQVDSVERLRRALKEEHRRSNRYLGTILGLRTALEEIHRSASGGPWETANVQERLNEIAGLSLRSLEPHG